MIGMTKEQAEKLAARIKSEVQIWTDGCIGESYSYHATFGIVHQSANIVHDVMCVLDPANEILEKLLKSLEREETTLGEWWNAVCNDGYESGYKDYKKEIGG